MAEQSAVTGHLHGLHALRASEDSAAWARAYLWRAAVGDVTCAVVAGVLAVQVSLTAAVAIASYAFKLNVARGYVALAMPSTALLDLVMRYWLRKHLHRMRDAGRCLRRVVVVGHGAAIAELAAMLRRSSYHGMSIVGACLGRRHAGPRRSPTFPSSASWTASPWRWTVSARTP